MKRIYTPTKKRTILIVDDDQIVLHIYREKFQGQGFKVETADNGGGVIKRLRQDPIDLVILDLCLPGLNGVEILKDIRSEFDTAALPVIVFANAYLGNLMRTALAAGATKCVTKAETTPARMLDLVRELLGDTQLKPSEALASHAELKSQQLLVSTLLANTPHTLAKLRAGYQALTRTEEEELRQTSLGEMQLQVHSLVGTVNLIGFAKIAQMAGAVEALLVELRAAPKKITPSVVRTLGQAIDTIVRLTDDAKDFQPEVSELPSILVVDDEVISRQMICAALGKANLVVTSLDDSLAARALLERDHFDLIFLDVEMPGLSGLELCAKIRDMPVNRATPVVFITAHSDFGVRAQSALSGGKDFIAKPFFSAELAVKALTWLFPGNARTAVTITTQSNSPGVASTDVFQRPAHPVELSIR